MVGLKDLSTLRALYKEGQLKAAASALFPFRDGLLDQIVLFQGDITKLELDSIVNAANSSLLGGGGVDGAIHAAAGPDLVEECRGLNGCETGHSKITQGYNLPSRHVIHTVGPVYSQSDVDTKAEQLASCYKTSLQLAKQHSLESIAFPSISTGIYGYPVEDATRIALNVVRRFLDNEPESVNKIVFTVWSNKDKLVYEQLLPEVFPPPSIE